MFRNVTNEELRKVFIDLAIKVTIGMLFVSAIAAAIGVTFPLSTDTPNYSSDIEEIQSRLVNLETTSLENRVSALEQEEKVSQPLVISALPASTPIADCIEDEKVIRFPYIVIGEEPVPVGSQVEFVQTCSGKDVIKWVEKISRGQKTRYFLFDSVNFSVRDFLNHSSSSTYISMKSGMTVTLDYYFDIHKNDGSYGDDGVVDGVHFTEVVEWYQEEAELVKLGNEFYLDAVQGNFFYLSYTADCQPTEYRMNGLPIQPADYGNTYRVPSNGGTLEAFYASGKCGVFEKDTVRWSVEVHPGDIVEGMEFYIQATSMEDPDPWYFCSRVSWIVPQWQPEYLPDLAGGACVGLYSRYDDSDYAILAREGFLYDVFGSGRDYPKYWVPFISKAEGRDINHTWPEHSWVDVENIVLDEETVYTVSLDEEGLPVITLVGGEHESSSAYTSDIPWYDLGTEIVFHYSRWKGMDHSFDWREDTQMFRVIALGDELIVQKAIWSAE